MKKQRKMKAYLIDPFCQQITRVEYNDDYHQIYEFIGNGCTAFDAVRLPRGDGIYVDDEGLFKPGLMSFGIRGREEPGIGIAPLFGRGLVLGCNSEGDSTSPAISFEDLHKVIVWTNYITTGGPQ